MKAVIQRVLKASVLIEKHDQRSIDHGLLILLGIGRFDKLEDVIQLANKILNLRIFSQGNKMNESVLDVRGSLLIVSQFTLYADCKKGNRPSFINAAPSVHAKKIYNEFVNYMHQHQINCKSGEFGAHMEVSLVNDGPVTLIVDTKE
ncbi:MAG: D-tyrosyl-tRNA(Tyr) deacylase [Candidatus Marinimicrobia bacterium]|nr:D-tyrosyl-tRNA(Tyr) deacylase [Candidatus Neomarinimicrobiota bacterium]